LRFTKYGYVGIYGESRRNNDPWEFLTIDTESPYLDERPLLSPGTPEIREYRARFWNKSTPNGEWTDVVKVTSPPNTPTHPPARREPLLPPGSRLRDCPLFCGRGERIVVVAVGHAARHPDYSKRRGT